MHGVKLGEGAQGLSLNWFRGYFGEFVLLLAQTPVFWISSALRTEFNPERSISHVFFMQKWWAGGVCRGFAAPPGSASR